MYEVCYFTLLYGTVMWGEVRLFWILKRHNFFAFTYNGLILSQMLGLVEFYQNIASSLL